MSAAGAIRPNFFSIDAPASIDSNRKPWIRIDLHASVISARRGAIAAGLARGLSPQLVQQLELALLAHVLCLLGEVIAHRLEFGGQCSIGDLVQDAQPLRGPR